MYCQSTQIKAADFSALTHMGLVFQKLHPKLTSLFGVSGFEHVLSDPPLLAVAWPPANHVAPDDYAEHLLPSDAQLEINTDKNPQISLQNFRVWTRKNKWEGDSRPEMKTVLGRETSLKVGKSWTEITLAAWDCLVSALKRTVCLSVTKTRSAYLDHIQVYG